MKPWNPGYGVPKCSKLIKDCIHKKILALKFDFGCIMKGQNSDPACRFWVRFWRAFPSSDIKISLAVVKGLSTLRKGSTRAVKLEFDSRSGNFEAKSYSFLICRITLWMRLVYKCRVGEFSNLPVTRLTCQTMEGLGKNQPIGGEREYAKKKSNFVKLCYILAENLYFYDTEIFFQNSMKLNFRWIHHWPRDQSDERNLASTMFYMWDVP